MRLTAFPPILRSRRAARAACIACALVFATQAHAEGKVRIVEQFGIGSLLLKGAKDQKLIENEGAKEGLAIDVQWSELSGGAAVNDTLLSGAADVATIGICPLLTVWDRTHGKQDFRAMAALGAVPVYLVTNNPRIRTIQDFGEADRVAVGSVAGSQQGPLLQIASAKGFGDDQYARLDALEVSMPHADATTAMLVGNSSIDAHFSNAPFQYQELENPKIHKVLSSSDILGGPST